MRLETNVIPAVKDTPFPHADTDAARTLQSAINKAKVKNKTSLRTIAKTLNYRQAAVLSHMASGRIPIPVERAEKIAVALDINPSAFMKMVLKQRYPNMSLAVEQHVFEHQALLNGLDASLPPGLNNATPSQMRIIREVLRDDHASERWLSPHEVFFVSEIRKLRPGIIADGLSSDDLQQVRLALGRATLQPESGN